MAHPLLIQIENGCAKAIKVFRTDLLILLSISSGLKVAQAEAGWNGEGKLRASCHGYRNWPIMPCNCITSVLKFWECILKIPLHLPKYVHLVREQMLGKNIFIGNCRFYGYWSLSSTVYMAWFSLAERKWLVVYSGRCRLRMHLICSTDIWGLVNRFANCGRGLRIAISN